MATILLIDSFIDFWMALLFPISKSKAGRTAERFQLDMPLVPIIVFDGFLKE